MQITIDGKNFELNVEACKNAGFLKPMRENITDCRFGDVFGAQGYRVIVAQSEYSRSGGKAFCMLGLGGLKAYSNTSGTYSKEEVLDFLNRIEFNYLGNINEGISRLMDDLRVNE